MDDEQDVKYPSSFYDELKRAAANIDKGREPEFISGRMGTRQYSIKALLERIINAFIDEHGRDSVALKSAQTPAQRYALILATASYVIGVESILISDAEKADIIRKAYAELFTFGPLDALFLDESITTITLEGADKASVRYGHGELVAQKPLFEDTDHLNRIVRRLLYEADADISIDTPLIETGLLVGERRISLNIASPPITYLLSVDIRLHPSKPVTLADMVASGVMTQTACDVLMALAKSAHGVMIVGETESGKTTLLGAMLQHVTTPLVSVERAGELRLPENGEQLVVQWKTDDHQAIPFGERVHQALSKNPPLLVLDEVRADEPESIVPLLTESPTPRLMWAFRGTTNSKRLVAALGILARKSNPEQGDMAVKRLYERLPFVVGIRRHDEKLKLTHISEWQFANESDYPNYVELLARGWDDIELTGKRPMKHLDLPDNFWG
ncbi:MAG: Flp pilus assembly complex ATPase component TadA [Anaerolineae bacterium]|jgi:type IV secretory pathway ATPase VirB11/archaellum biosynthesis ATPase|nr:Flp pilus assembly complex ATPase component TadA [Anaerolineae bacterium]